MNGRIVGGHAARIVSAFALSLLTACTGAKLTDVPLGKVVVYRNGVAYFERLANVNDGQISLLVAQSKVDDLLKSLTVRDAETGKSLPISFPSRTAGDGLVRMTIRVPGKQSRKVKLSYVSESPAWKPTYRLNLAADGEMMLQGWAIVDNASGEDWNKVMIGVGSTSALSFRYDLWSVRDVHRQTLGHKERLATAPPTATGVIVRAKAPAIDPTSTGQAITLSQEYTQNIPVPGRTFESALGTAAGSSDSTRVSFSGSASLENQYVIDGVNTTGLSYGTIGNRDTPRRRSTKEIEAERKRRELYLRRRQVAQAEAAKLQRRNDQLADQIARTESAFVIEGIASPSARNGQAVALSMANHLRNEMIKRGVSPGKLSVEVSVGAIGEPTTLKVAPRDEASDESAEISVVGESKFLSTTQVSIPHEGSSMVPIVEHSTVGNVVYLYDALSPRGNKHFAFKAIRFRNPTKKHLEGGPIMVFGDETFIGEGLTESIAPGASTILPYALDKQVHVQREESFDDTVVGIKAILDDGAIVAKQRLSTVTFTVHNRAQGPATVYIRHDTDRGWQLKKGPANLERLGRMSVFPVKLSSGERKTVQLVEFAPVTATLDLTTDDGVESLARYLRADTDNSAFSTSAKKLVADHRSISKKLKKIDHVAGQMVIYRDRLDDLHVQIVTLEAVQSRGKLVRDLQQRMKDMSTRVQKAIIEIVELREQIMVERFAYRDLITKLSEIAI